LKYRKLEENVSNGRRDSIKIATRAAAALVLPAASQLVWGQSTSLQASAIVKLIVPFPPGGTTDILGRIAAAEFNKIPGFQAIVENRAGAGGNIGSEIVSKAAPDGNTLLVCTVGTHGINASLYNKLPYDPIKDFEPITLLATVPNVLVVHPSLPVNSVSDLIKFARSKPGKLNYASSGNGTSIHLSGELFKAMTGTFMTHIPYRGSAPALIDLVAGQVDLMFDNLPSALPFIKAGKLRAIALTSSKPSSALPGIPTIASTGIDGYEASSWFGLMAPAKTPAAMVQRYQQVIAKSLQQADIREKMLGQGAEPVGNTPEEFGAYIKAEIAKWGKVVKSSGAKID
jgi:tripartite-type tricarboxylate transporter receptor subunit TctC